MPFTMIYITFPNEEECKALSKKLMDKKLVACANIHPMDSLYFWKDEFHNDAEFVAILKTRTSLKNRVEEEVLKLHSYDLPCIISWEVSANKTYEDWIHKETCE